MELTTKEEIGQIYENYFFTDIAMIETRPVQ